MKRFTLMMLTALIAVFAFAQKGNLKSFEAHPFMLGKTASAPVAMQAKQAPAGLAQKIAAKNRRAAKRVAAADLAGDYTWDFLQAKATSTDLESLETTAGSAHVSIAEDAEGGLTVSGMFSNPLKATIDAKSNLLVIEGGQLAGTSSYGDYVIQGLFYYEGDDENSAGWYYSDIYGAIGEDGIVTFGVWLSRVLSGGQYDGYALTPYWVEGSTLTPAEPLTVVEVPEGLVTEDYVITARNYKDDADVSGTIAIGFDGNDVYMKGLSTWIPEAWVKGTLDGTTITFAYGQYFGVYQQQYEMFLNVLLGKDVVFNYDAVSGTLTAVNEFFLVDNSEHYFDSYRNAVLKKVTEKAAMPANPTITDLTNSSYGYVLQFNIPLTDVNGDALLASKLSYIIYSDIEGEIAPMTFTPETHTRLTESMTEIPYGFTENYDFYDTQIYLNDLYSKDWNKIGIKSIYKGGDETNETEIQWFDIKPYAEPIYPDATWIAAEQGYENSEVVTEFTIAEGITAVVNKAAGKNDPAYYTSGEALRLYAGNTLTITSEEEIGKIEFTMTGAAKQMLLEANEGMYSFDNESLVGTWTGEANEIVFTVPAGSGNQARIKQIDIFFKSSMPQEDILVTLPEGVEPQTWTIEGTFADSNSADEIQRATEVAIVGNDVYVKGIPFYFEDSWMKGTLNAETGIVTFPSGQFVGEDDNGKEYMIGSNDTKTICDIEFAYDAEAKTLTQMTNYIIENADTRDEIAPYGYWYDMVIYAGEPVIIEPVTPPADLVADSYLFNAMVQENKYDENDNPYLSEPTEYSYQMQIGFDGNDVYFKSFSEDTADMWAKGTLSEDGKTVTIPANQYMGQLTILWYTFKYYLTAIDEQGNMIDIVLNYDAEKNTFTTNQALVLHDGKRKLGTPYQVFTNVEITKLQDIAATPATPNITKFSGDAESDYRSIMVDVPTTDVDGNDLVYSKLFYTIWVEKGNAVEQITFSPDLYKKLTEDMTEIPYGFTDSYDIFTSGRVYLNQSVEEIQSWTKIGVQSIYYGGGERKVSEMGWFENPMYETTTGISALKANDLRNAVIYNLAGQRIQTPQKGLNIINGKKVVVK